MKYKKLYMYEKHVLHGKYVLHEKHDNKWENMAKKKPRNMTRHKRNSLFYGAVTVGERGQITIPAAARKTFDLQPGDKILVFGDIDKGLGLVKEDQLQKIAMKMFQVFKPEENNKRGND